jgi:hypothetical protein
MAELTAEQEKVLKEFKAIRDVLRVPFPQDLQDLTPPEFPADRRWKGPCLGYQEPVIYVDAMEEAEKSKTEKRT